MPIVRPAVEVVHRSRNGQRRHMSPKTAVPVPSAWPRIGVSQSAGHHTVPVPNHEVVLREQPVAVRRGRDLGVHLVAVPVQAFAKLRSRIRTVTHHDRLSAVPATVSPAVLVVVVVIVVCLVAGDAEEVVDCVLVGNVGGVTTVTSSMISESGSIDT